MDEVSEISSTEMHSFDDVRPSFYTTKPHVTSSPFTKKTLSTFTLVAKSNTTSISPRKSPLSSSAAAVCISRASPGISGTRNLPADRHMTAGSSFMKSDHISRLNFNSVSTTSVSNDDSALQWLSSFSEARTPNDADSAVQWLSSFSEARTPSDADSALQWLSGFSEARTPGTGFACPQQQLVGTVNSTDEDMNPPVLKPKVHRASHHTPDKSPLVSSSSGDILELGKPSVGLGQPASVGTADSDPVEFEEELSDIVKVSGSVTNDFGEEPDHDRFPIYAKNTKHRPASSDHRTSHKMSKPSAKDKVTSKSGSRSAKQKARSPASSDDYEKQRLEQSDAFEAACRLPSTVSGQPSLLDTQKVSALCYSYLFHCMALICLLS